MSAHDAIDDFLSQKRLAVVGVSRDPRDVSRRLFATLRERGYDVVPVSTSAEEIDGLMCYASLKEIPRPVDGALLVTTPAETAKVVVECHEAGICRVWMYRDEGIGSVNPVAIEFCETHGISVVPGYSPLMFLPETVLPHHLHSWVINDSGFRTNR